MSHLQVSMSKPQPSGEHSTILAELPDDILCLVFEWAHELGNYSQEERQETPLPLEVETTLTRVCTLWRKLVLSLPKMWATFRFRKAASFDGYVGEYNRLGTYLFRSVNQDLDLVFDCVGIPVWRNMLIVILLLVPPHIHRLWRFVLHSDATNRFTPFDAAFLNVSAPRLEHFEICHRSTGEACHKKTDWDPRIIVHGPSNIKYLKLDANATTQFRSPISNLVHFPLHGGLARQRVQLPWRCFEQIISLCFIETISLWDDVVQAAPSRGYTFCSFEAKHLKHFRIGNTWHLLPLLYLVYHVSAPALETVAITESLLDAYPHPMDEDGAGGPEHPFPSLRSLYLYNVQVPIVTDATIRALSFWAHFLAKTRALTHLSISYVYSSTPDVLPRSSFWSTVSSGEWYGGEVPTDVATRIWPNVKLLDVNQEPEFDEEPDFYVSAFCSKLWPQLSAIRTPTGSRPRCFDSRTVEVQELCHLFPYQWPPDYRFSGSVPTHEFPYHLRVHGA